MSVAPSIQLSYTILRQFIVLLFKVGTNLGTKERKNGHTKLEVEVCPPNNKKYMTNPKNKKSCTIQFYSLNESKIKTELKV